MVVGSVKCGKLDVGCGILDVGCGMYNVESTI
jgi:hypothetical protein